ncbi:response regulator transcription factor [Alicyclobacillus sp. ALC3]|uniref:response regulator transcription factor n=1 Tax=Alicyclobacillus sp. ALC3 TaxID=2796143 RepID=UPI002379462C|nr:response regulator transcription factor [Alicyclobacillus sp. ALC3]WDL95633.1 response regulator transcription factor [Alicyclobacillus sp. ALC3]
MQNELLIIEDDVQIIEMLQNYLMKEGYVIATALDGMDGIHQFQQDRFDVVIVDVMMPRLDGIEVIKRIREQSAVPIIIMSAKDSDIDKVTGFGFGADDYIVKPFSLVEISARIKAAIRRATTYSPAASSTDTDASLSSDHLLIFDRLSIDLNNFTAWKDNVDLRLTAKEFEILSLFATNPKRVFTKAQLYEFIWKESYYNDENVINVHIRRLREKIEDQPSNPRYIKTLWGIGYRWEG